MDQQQAEPVDKLIPAEQQLSKLPELAALISNPWWLHFQQLWYNSADNCMTSVKQMTILGFGQAVTREQVIGESRAYDLCAEGPTDKYNELVRKMAELEKGQ
jgi:hypothetical protein